MSFEVFAFIVAILISIALIFLVIWNIIAFDDLKTDYKNPVDLCNSLNPLVLPEYLVHGGITLLFLFGGQWSAVVFNIPLLAYHVHRYINRPMMSSAGLYDPTEVMNASEMWRCQKEGWIKLAFYLISFFYYLYRMMYALLV
ncbi:protein cornichon homolog 1 [Exaiptasia diaphana]|uniref:Cornichon n=1 Tax=Exaiptasia diaphana TaxID=2652724 RepID=A0A913X007_EXADI|nr:protein cornichon homolog 1 [Exaiptasia diaphana]KXJ29873.1 Protein cornichon [Exaiptasia diaphana]